MAKKMIICSHDLKFSERLHRLFHDSEGIEVLMEPELGRLSQHLSHGLPFEFCFIDRERLTSEGIQALYPLIEKYPQTFFLLVGDTVEQQEEITAILFGMKGFILKSLPDNLLTRVVSRVRVGEIWVDRQFVSRLLQELSQVIHDNIDEFDDHVFDRLLESLTPRELEIAKLVCTGASNPRIAQILMITERTVKAHLGAIFQKLNVVDRLQLALFMSQAFRVLSRLSKMEKPKSH